MPQKVAKIAPKPSKMAQMATAAKNGNRCQIWLNSGNFWQPPQAILAMFSTFMGARQEWAFGSLVRQYHWRVFAAAEFESSNGSRCQKWQWRKVWGEAKGRRKGGSKVSGIGVPFF